MKQQELIQLIEDWLEKHPRLHIDGIKESVYCHIIELLISLKKETLSDNVVDVYRNSFLRFKYYYY